MHLFLKNCKHLYVCYNMIVLLEYDDCFNRVVSCDCGSDSLIVFPILILVHNFDTDSHSDCKSGSVVITHHKQNELKCAIFVESLPTRHLYI